MKIDSFYRFRNKKEPKMSNENLQMQVIADAVQKSSSVQFVSDSPITDPRQKVIIRINLTQKNIFIQIKILMITSIINN